MEHIKDVKPISLGDLCKLNEENEDIVLTQFKEIENPIYHTIGNCETVSSDLGMALFFCKCQYRNTVIHYHSNNYNIEDGMIR